jgi:signal transduction histidine kinase
VGESEDLRTFIRELLIRFDRRMDRFDQRMDRQSAERQRYFDLLYEQGERESRRIDDLIAEGRAGREALFRILDRMDGNGGPAAAGGT